MTKQKWAKKSGIGDSWDKLFSKVKKQYSHDKTTQHVVDSKCGYA